MSTDVELRELAIDRGGAGGPKLRTRRHVLTRYVLPLLLIFDFAWPFRVAAFSLLLSAVDETAITCLLPECRHDVPSVLHVLRLRSRIASESSRRGNHGLPLL